MFYSILLLVGLISISQCQAESSFTKYEEIPIDNNALQVVLYDTFSKNFFCGGFLFNPYYGITAARCVFSYRQTLYKLKVFFAMTSINDKSYDIERVIIHRDFAPYILNNQRNNIALIKLLWPVLGLNIQYGILPNEDETIEHGRPVKVLEFGETANVIRAQVLQKKLNIVGRGICRSHYHRDLVGYFITEYHVCAQNARLESCVGSLGFPLVDTQRRIIGIVTFPFICGRLLETRFPAVYTLVSSYVSWIHQILRTT